MAALLVAAPARAGEAYSVIQKLFGADAIVRVRLTFDRPIPKRWPNKDCQPLGWAFPLHLADRASRRAKVEAVLMGDFKESDFHFDDVGPAITDCWWWTVHRAGQAELLLFLACGPDGHCSQIQGVEGVDEPSPGLLDWFLRWKEQAKPARVRMARQSMQDKDDDIVDAAVAALCLDARDSLPAWIERDRVRRWSRYPGELASYCDGVRTKWRASR